MSTAAAPSSRAAGAAASPLRLSERAARAKAVLVSATPNAAFNLIVVYVVMDYVRPQDLPWISFLRVLRPSLFLMLAVLGYLLTHRQAIPSGERKFVLLGAIALFMMGWVPFARNTFWAFQTWLDLCSILVFVVAFTSIVDTRERFQRFVHVWLGALLFQSVWSMNHHGRGNGAPFGDENDLALALAIGLPFAVLTAFSGKSSTRRSLLFIAGGFLVAGIVASRSRGGFVGLGVTWLMLLILSHRRMFMIGATAIAFAGLLMLAPPDYFDEMKTIQDEQDSTRVARMNMWTVAWAAFLDNPVLGVGQGNIRWRINDYQVWDDRTGRSYAGHQVHSLYFTLLPELGAVGTTMYAWILLLNVKDCRRVMRRREGSGKEPLGPYARALLCSLAAFLAAGAFISVLYYPHFYYLTAASLALRRISTREEALGQRDRSAPGSR